jgi:hypothetical protein
MLKAKYFPHCHILQVGPKSNYSFTWQSIAAGIETSREVAFGEYEMELRSKFGKTHRSLLAQTRRSSQLQVVLS